MTQEVITMWYRPPELLLGGYNYSVELDMWSVGCIMAELFLREPLFQGKSEIEQLDTIFKAVGSPTEDSWQDLKSFKNYCFVQGKKYPLGSLNEIMQKAGISKEGLDLLKGLLTANPKKRMTARKALSHVWFKGETSSR